MLLREVVRRLSFVHRGVDKQRIVVCPAARRLCERRRDGLAQKLAERNAPFARPLQRPHLQVFGKHDRGPMHDAYIIPSPYHEPEGSATDGSLTRISPFVLKPGISQMGQRVVVALADPGEMELTRRLGAVGKT